MLLSSNEACRKSCPGGEIGKLTTLKMLRRKACGFKSRPGHQK